MGNGIFQAIVTPVKTKFVHIVTKVRLWTSFSFIRTKLLAKIKLFITGVFDVKPKHKKDYYEIFGWLVSKRLAFAIVVVSGALSLIYLMNMYAPNTGNNSGSAVKEYKYDSLLLRLAKGNVRITGESGYLAYEGNVENGAVNGKGKLYAPSGTLLYNGSFENNCYEGEGTQYYKTGVMHYRGSFSENLYEGSGRLYNEAGNLSYEGEFAKGLKQGMGKLYDIGGNIVYEGEFAADELVYSSFLGKSAKEAAQCYTGRRSLYESEEGFIVIMKDISAAYAGKTDNNALDGEIQIEQMYVLKDTFDIGSEKYRTIEELDTYFGEPDYAGNSNVTEQEAVCINYTNTIRPEKTDKIDMDVDTIYDDSCYINSYDKEAEVYLYSYNKDGIVYTFVCRERGKGFLFYSMMSEEGDVAE